ncbi:hypothetical protein PI125_g24673 [Phytophthora idaei]|nr:hypothetical protein PI125_g24673 [Phytophthora idaei]KAG3125533.1 hypothetical protein PI126_g22721 [Phytophthora idaei]
MQRRAERRLGIFADLDLVALLETKRMMTECNPLAKKFPSVGEQVRQQNTESIVDLVFPLHDNSAQPRTHNRPTGSEVAATLMEDGNLAQPRDLLLSTRDQAVTSLRDGCEVRPTSMPTATSDGEVGWNYTDLFVNGAQYRNNNK